MTGTDSARAMLDAQEPLFLVDPLGSVIECNTPAARLLGVKGTRAVSVQCHDLLRGRARDGTPICRSGCPYLDAAAQGVGPSPIDMIVPRDSGSAGIDDLLLSVHHVRTQAGGQILVLHLLEDVRARRQAERIGTRLEALRSGEAIPGPLTRREVDVLRLVAEGLASGELASRLGIRPSTARNHLSRILNKLGASNRTAALANFLADQREAARLPPDAGRGILRPAEPGDVAQAPSAPAAAVR